MLKNKIWRFPLAILLVALVFQVSLARDISQNRNFEPETPKIESKVRNILLSLSNAFSSPRGNFGLKTGIKDDDLTRWIDGLISYENCSPLGTPDKGSLSYGCLCYKSGTFREQIRRYEMLPQAEWNELINYIGDCSIQKELAYKMLEDKPLNWRHWWTSVKLKKYGLPPDLTEDKEGG